MLPGPEIIKACPYCNELIKIPTHISGNTFGAVYWTDGKMEAPMYPKEIPFIKCKKCNNFYWVKNAKIIEDLHTHQIKNNQKIMKWNDIPTINELTEDEYYESIDNKIYINLENEKQIRIEAWWKTNDKYRKNRNQQIYNSKCLNNMKKLCHILNEEKDQDILMKAELFRELGEFDKALSLLEKIKDINIQNYKLKIKKLCNNRSTKIEQI